MNTTENNKIIAEFMELSYCEKYQFEGWYTNHEHNYRICDFDGLKYHLDWNWLMEVVEKIEGLEGKKYYVVIKHVQCKFSNYYTEETIANVIHTHNKIESVYLACVEFIKWYNLKN